MLGVSGGRTSADHKVTVKPTDKLFKVISHQKWHGWHGLSLVCDFSNSSLWLGYPHIREE